MINCTDQIGEYTRQYSVSPESQKYKTKIKSPKFGPNRINKWTWGVRTLRERWTCITWIWVSSSWVSRSGAGGWWVRCWCSGVWCCWSSSRCWVRHPSWGRGWWVSAGITPRVRSCSRRRSVRFDRVGCLHAQAGWVCGCGVPWRGYVRRLRVWWGRISRSSCES